MNQLPVPVPARAPAAPARSANLASTVLWSFFGVRKRCNMEADLAQLRPVPVIAAGIAGAALFVLLLLTVVKIVTA